jgi:hypothetical protein
MGNIIKELSSPQKAHIEQEKKDIISQELKEFNTKFDGKISEQEKRKPYEDLVFVCNDVKAEYEGKLKEWNKILSQPKPAPPPPPKEEKKEEKKDDKDKENGKEEKKDSDNAEVAGSQDSNNSINPTVTDTPITNPVSSSAGETLTESTTLVDNANITSAADSSTLTAGTFIPTSGYANTPANTNIPTPNLSASSADIGDINYS